MSNKAPIGERSLYDLERDQSRFLLVGIFVFIATPLFVVVTAAIIFTLRGNV